MTPEEEFDAAVAGALEIGRALGELVGVVEQYADSYTDDEIRSSLILLKQIEDAADDVDEAPEAWRLMYIGAAAIRHVRRAVADAYNRDFDRIVEGFDAEG